MRAKTKKNARKSNKKNKKMQSTTNKRQKSPQTHYKNETGRYM